MKRGEEVVIAMNDLHNMALMKRGEEVVIARVRAIDETRVDLVSSHPPPALSR